MPLIITSLGGGHTDTDTHIYIYIYIYILRGQVQFLEIKCSKYHINDTVVNNTKHKGTVTESYTVSQWRKQ